MKKLIPVFVMVTVLLSCSKNDNFDIEKYPQKWQLIKMSSGMVPNSETSGENMEWQEYYLLNSDGTFTKHREWDGSQTEASGTFSFTEGTDGKYLKLFYNEESTLIGNCSGDNTESLWLRSERKLTGTWLACDGPGLEYERVE